MVVGGEMRFKLQLRRFASREIGGEKVLIQNILLKNYHRVTSCATVRWWQKNYIARVRMDIEVWVKGRSNAICEKSVESRLNLKDGKEVL